MLIRIKQNRATCPSQHLLLQSWSPQDLHLFLVQGQLLLIHLQTAGKTFPLPNNLPTIGHQAKRSVSLYLLAVLLQLLALPALCLVAHRPAELKYHSDSDQERGISEP